MGLGSSTPTDDEKVKQWQRMYSVLRLAHTAVPEVSASQVLEAGGARGLWPVRSPNQPPETAASSGAEMGSGASTGAGRGHS